MLTVVSNMRQIPKQVLIIIEKAKWHKSGIIGEVFSLNVYGALFFAIAVLVVLVPVVGTLFLVVPVGNVNWQSMVRK